MGEKINNLIAEVEQQWLSLLYNHCRKTFEGCFIPSHDHYHHYRVWHFARQLFSALDHAGKCPPTAKIEQAIISVFFHDLGLSRTLEENHGAESRDMCIDFFRSNKLPYPGGFDEILHAIEKHDEKSVIQATPGGAAGKYGLLNILRTCDDLDAFGYTGIYRYAEIYMLRGITDDILAERVLPNLANRYQNFSAASRELAAFAREQDSRYQVTSDFFSGLKDEMYHDHQVKYRHLIIKLFQGKILLKENLLEPGLKISIDDKNEKIQEFFNLLRKEINSYQYP